MGTVSQMGYNKYIERRALTPRVGAFIMLFFEEIYCLNSVQQILRI